MIRKLESRYPASDPVPKADCILVLGGGTVRRVAPRKTVEVDDAGDRVLYAAYLYRQGQAPLVICTAGGTGPRPSSEDMAELLENIGVPKAAIFQETKSMNTREHARNLYPVLKERGYKRILLVTSAMHMPRSMGVMKKGCPDIEFIPAPTDFRIEESTGKWYHQVFAPIPTPRQLLNFSEVMHEYLGLAYYKMRGWM